uniref:Endoribonuclease n=2 Tax=Schistosoma mansoni TaxID=6183 RepID=A0A3Q0KSN6_SCHMA
MKLRISVLFIKVYILTVIYFITISCTSENHDYEYSHSLKLSKITNDSYILIHTLGGEILCVHRRSGYVRWKFDSASALSASYDNGPFLVVDPVSGSLYEYASSVSEFLFQQLDHSIMGHVRRSPAYYKNFLSLGSKSDFWTSVDMNSGKIFESIFQNYVDKCPTSLNNENVNNMQNSTEEEIDIINLGRTQYNLVLRDRFTGLVRLNITYNTFASHTEADLQNYDLQHVAITQPALVTFEGSKLIWSLPLSSPVIGMYALWSPSDSSSSVHATNENTHSNINSNSKESIKATTKLPRILRRIAFTTYALDLHNITNPTDDQIYDELEAKFNGTLDLAPSLYIGRSKSTPVYALMCLAEATLRIRGLRRASEMYMLEGPKNLIVMGNNQQTTTTKTIITADTNNNDNYNNHKDNWPTGLNGLYELPTSYKKTSSWDDNRIDDQPMSTMKRGKRLKRLTSVSSDSSTMWAVIVPPPSPLTNPTETVNSPKITILQDLPVNKTCINGVDNDSDDKHAKITLTNKLFWFLSMFFTVLCILSVFVYFINNFVKSNTMNCLTFISDFKTICKNFNIVYNFVSKSYATHIDMKNSHLSASALKTKTDLSQETSSIVAGLLPSHFDTPDSSGWAGCSAHEVGQPEPIRFNLNKVLGHGANGTMVFAGTYGPHETAVKRIVRHPLLEKHWRREHAILLKHQHPHLVRCYWTGSTANFHYLVMQRCSLSLNEALSSLSASNALQSDDINSTDPNKASLLNDLGLTPVQIIHQFILAVACLHRNQIVHRDLKPSNILIILDNNSNKVNNNNSTGKARVVVGDFGLSRPLPTDQHEQQHQDTFNSIGPHISVKIQQIKSRSLSSSYQNNSSVEFNSSENDVQSNATSITNNNSNNIFGISVRYGDQEEYTPDIVNNTRNPNVNNYHSDKNQVSDNSVCFTFGTLGWMAPELCDAESASQVTCAIDIFACGLLAYYVLTYGKHPYDCCSKELNKFQIEKNTQSTSICSSVSSSSSFTTGGGGSVGNNSDSVNELKSFRCTTLSRQHERQLAIAERRLPNLDILTENPINVHESYLARYLIQTMLSSDPKDRPTAEEITYYPLFWSPNKVIRFISELSNVMDIKDLSFDISSQNCTATNHSVDTADRNCTQDNNDNDNNGSSTPTTMSYQSVRQLSNNYHQQQMLNDLIRYTNWVFNEHWFSRLESELVDNLLSTRSYQDTSLLYLLRAIRNKHNHIWSLPEPIRAMYGYNQEGMAIYWTMRFPALLPLIYGLCNKHFTGTINFSEFLPPKSICKVFVGAPTNCPWWPIWNISSTDNNEINEISTQENNSTKPHFQFSRNANKSRKLDMNSRWKRGDIVHPCSFEPCKPSDIMNKSIEVSVKHEYDQELKYETIYPNEVDPNVGVCNDSTVDSRHRRRRPNQPKKIRPSKKQFTIQRRQDIISIAGTELPATYENR